MSRPILTSHVLDTAHGTPAAGLFVELHKKRDNGDWTLWHSTTTTGDGRIQFPFTSDSMAAGSYKLAFNVREYYKRHEQDTIYDIVEIAFTTQSGQHYHIPLILSPYGYSTYRGS